MLPDIDSASALVSGIACRYGPHVIVGLPWKQHIAVLADRQQNLTIRKRATEGVRLCSKHPAVLERTSPIGLSQFPTRRKVTRKLLCCSRALGAIQVYAQCGLTAVRFRVVSPAEL